jgi:hypothetical protein
MTGPDFAAELEAFFQANPTIGRFKFGRLVRRRGGLVEEFRAIGTVKTETIERIRAAMANPPQEVFIIPMEQRKKRPPSSVAGGRRAQSIRRQVNQAAEKNLRDGIDPKSVKRAHVRQAMYALAKQQTVELDPIQQAIRKLQRHRPTYSAAIVGGPRGMFYHGCRLIDQDELLRLAA